jgi:hypothetical protein
MNALAEVSACLPGTCKLRELTDYEMKSVESGDDRLGSDHGSKFPENIIVPPDLPTLEGKFALLIRCINQANLPCQCQKPDTSIKSVLNYCTPARMLSPGVCLSSHCHHTAIIVHQHHQGASLIVSYVTLAAINIPEQHFPVLPRLFPASNPASLKPTPSPLLPRPSCALPLLNIMEGGKVGIHTSSPPHGYRSPTHPIYIPR